MRCVAGGLDRDEAARVLLCGGIGATEIRARAQRQVVWYAETRRFHPPPTPPLREGSKKEPLPLPLPGMEGSKTVALPRLFPEVEGSEAVLRAPRRLSG